MRNVEIRDRAVDNLHKKSYKNLRTVVRITVEYRKKKSLNILPGDYTTSGIDDSIMYYIYDEFYTWRLIDQSACMPGSKLSVVYCETNTRNSLYRFVYQYYTMYVSYFF